MCVFATVRLALPFCEGIDKKMYNKMLWKMKEWVFRTSNFPPHPKIDRRKQMMDASEFKHQQLNAIERRKKIKRFLFVSLSVIAVLLLVAVAFVYVAD